MSYRLLPVALLGFIVMALCGCGFQPRGADALPAALSSVYLEGDSSTRLYRELSRALQARSATVVSRRASATSTIVLHEEENNQRILSVAATEGPEEYEVFQTVIFSLTLNDQPAIERQRLTLTRGYTYDRNDILGKQHEYESLRAALAREMAQSILRRARYVQ